MAWVRRSDSSATSCSAATSTASVATTRRLLFELDVWETGRPGRARLRPVEIDRLSVETVEDDRAAWWRETMRERSAPFGTADAFERDGAGLALSLCRQTDANRPTFAASTPRLGQ